MREQECAEMRETWELRKGGYLIVAEVDGAKLIMSGWKILNESNFVA